MTDLGIDLHRGIMTFDEFTISAEQPLTLQLDNLKEDMLQVEFSDKYLLDVGWRPSFDVEGKFHVYLIHNHDWASPVYHGTARNLGNLQKIMGIALSKIQNSPRTD